jgi:hypothetical protein
MRLATCRPKATEVAILRCERPISTQETAQCASTALVRVAADEPTASAGCAGARPRADFLAHLIATTAQLPQARLRRRAAPEEAVAAYGARDRLSVPERPIFSRSL